MTRIAFLAAALLAPASLTAQANGSTIDATNALGFSMIASGSDRDTLGLLVSAVLPDGPADIARIDNGNRIAEIDGVSLRLGPADVGRHEAEDALARRVTRELRSLQPGDEVTLRVYAAGRYRSATLRVSGERAVPSRATAGTRDDEPIVLPASGLASRGDATFDSLADIELELARIQQRLRALRGAAPRATTARPAATVREIRGLRVTPVSDDLSGYFGEGSAGGLLVLEADSTWDPIRAGDIILRVDEVPADAERLSAALQGRGSKVEVMRRRRVFVMTIGGTNDE